MKEILALENPILEYAWGSRTAIAALLGKPVPSPHPQAELWMGAHPKAPSRAVLATGRIPLTELIAGQPAAILGDRVAGRFQGRLPFLFKVIAAEKPLSIQAHPDREQARAGFAREESQGVPLSAPHRSYRDDNHKPEIVCALTPFWGMSGFRSAAERVHWLRQVDPPELSREIRDLESHPDPAGLQRFLSALLLLDAPRREHAVGQVVDSARRHTGEDPVFDWILKLNAEYPGDIGVLMPLLLHLVRLEPGQALFLEAGELHAYLEGTAVELMANSDNVLRGGLTPKHVDVPELLGVLRFREKRIRILTPQAGGRGEGVYSSPAGEFRLSVLDVSPETPYRSPAERCVEILLAVEGAARIESADGSSRLDVRKGTSVLVPAAAGTYSVTGRARLYRASVP